MMLLNLAWRTFTETGPAHPRRQIQGLHEQCAALPAFAGQPEPSLRRDPICSGEWRKARRRSDGNARRLAGLRRLSGAAGTAGSIPGRHLCPSEFNLRPASFSVLTILDSTPGLRQTEVANLLGIQRPSFVTLFDSLEKRGLGIAQALARGSAVALPVPDDGGRAFWATVRERVNVHEAKMADILGHDDYETLKRILGKPVALP